MQCPHRSGFCINIEEVGRGALTAASISEILFSMDSKRSSTAWAGLHTRRAGQESMKTSSKIGGTEGEGGVDMAGLWGSVAGAHLLSATGVDLRLTDDALRVRHEDASIFGALG